MRREIPMDSNLIDVGNAKIYCRRFGDPARLPIVISTSMGGCSAEWWHVGEEWSDKYHLIAFDRPGYGCSDRAKGPRTPEVNAHELRALLNGLKVSGPVILIGHSLGGLYAQQFARLYPDSVRGLILLDPVSGSNARFRTELSKEEYRTSGVDKSMNFKPGLVICTLGLGFLLKPLLKKGPQRDTPPAWPNTLPWKTRSSWSRFETHRAFQTSCFSSCCTHPIG
jgi:pimeloyl-ACP methyl ester carboxylesterase